LAPDPFTSCFYGSDTCVLQKRRRMIKYDSNAEKLEKMMAIVGEGSNPEEGDGAEQETL